VKVPGKNGFATVQVLRKYQKKLKRIPTVKLSFTVGLIFQQTQELWTHFSEVWQRKELEEVKE